MKRMKKVIYSITKLGKVENTKVTGIGYITDEDLITANVSKTGKPYITVLEELGNNSYLVDYRGVKCSAIFNLFNCTYYADDIYGRLEK